jgi:glycosyltransferase involved in cell wall biosynthesis
VNILFVNYGDLTTASLNHIAVFAKVLGSQGHESVVAIPRGRDTLGFFSEPGFRPELYADLLARPRAFKDGRPADILHVWTPRECVRGFAEAYHPLAGRPPLIIHLEDNEEHLMEVFSGRSLGELRALDDRELGRLLPDALCHPRRYAAFLSRADAYTFLTPEIGAAAPKGPPGLLLPPGVDPSYFEADPRRDEVRSRLGLRPGERLIVYTGGTTFANDGDIRELYQAVVLLNSQGTPTRLLRTGISAEGVLESMPEAKPWVRETGFLPKAELPGLLAAADALVQPGSPGPFNDLRLPSKLPEYLASGRPVILPRSNLAHQLTDGAEALILEKGNASEIAGACSRVFADPGLARRLGTAGRAFALREFDGRARSQSLMQFYLRLVG